MVWHPLRIVGRRGKVDHVCGKNRLRVSQLLINVTLPYGDLFSVVYNRWIHVLSPGILRRSSMWLTREPGRCPEGPQQPFSKGCFVIASKPIHAFTSGNVYFQDFFLLFLKCQAQADKLLDELLQISPQRSWITSGRQWVLYFRIARLEGVSLRKPYKMVYCQGLWACLWLSCLDDSG